mmetsp:Transcript_20370/g.48968  ORF Transcript_20370/g.48968 Transcript_20370/m.48968 type:complete len:747 (+) Transcript_20370:41-2281(+)
MASPSQQQRPIRILFRSKDAVEVYTLPDTSPTAVATTTPSPATKGGTTLHRGKTTFHLLNPNGTCAYIHDANAGGLIRCGFDEPVGSNATPFLKDSGAIQLARCSPRGSYLLTWERPNSDKNNNNGNLKVWDAATGSFLRGFSCKKATLKTLQWTHDESLVFHLVTNEVHVYTNEFERVGKIRCQGVASFSMPSAMGSPPNNAVPDGNDCVNKYLLTAFVPGTKGKPARVDLLRYPDRTGRESSTVSGDKANVPSGPSLASKSLFNAEEAVVRWSPRADSALLITQTAVDATGESYYGSSHLFLLLENDPKRPGFGSAVSVPLPGEATKTSSVAGSTVPIVSADWITNPLINGPVPFGVISGRMPSLSSLHHGITAEPTFLFGRAHRNTMDVSPHGRFVVCGGYGNLAGGMDFWDRNKGKKIPRHVVLPPSNGDTKYVTIKEASDLSVTSSSPVVGHEWSPDSRTYLVSTTSPRMNVDNGVNIYRYDGSLVDQAELPWDNARYKPDKLLSAEYVPAPLPAKEESYYYYPDRPQSPPPRRFAELKGEAAKAALAKISSSQNGQSNNKAGGRGAPAAAAYVPPGARKAGGGGGGGSYVPPGARTGGAGRGGGSSLAERMRQEREGSAANVSGKVVTKRTGPVGASSVSAAALGDKSKSALRREKQRLAKEKAEREAAEAEERAREEEKAKMEANKADPKKRAKKINKTLKQIDDIKAKLADGVELNDDQKKKMASEEELRKELASLGL